MAQEMAGGAGSTHGRVDTSRYLYDLMGRAPCFRHQPLGRPGSGHGHPARPVELTCISATARLDDMLYGDEITTGVVFHYYAP